MRNLLLNPTTILEEDLNSIFSDLFTEETFHILALWAQ